MAKDTDQTSRRENGAPHRIQGNGRCRIALSGGPGGGKTSVIERFRKLHGESAAVVPEAATLLFAGGFPRSSRPSARRAAQTAIYHVQRNLEDAQAALHPGQPLLCDRGTIDGAVYWSDDPGEYFAALGTSFEAELARYDAVVFFETAAVGGISVEGGNPTRTESVKEAAELDRRLRRLWSQHPRFWLVPNNLSFARKLASGLALLERLVERLSASETSSTTRAATGRLNEAP